MENITTKIKRTIEKCILYSTNVIIYPFGEIGIQVKTILNSAYGIQESIIIDSELSKYNQDIKSLDILEAINTKDYVLILASINSDIIEQLKENAVKYFDEDMIFTIDIEEPWWKRATNNVHTEIGKYSSGPLCVNHPLIERIGAFCSFAEGCCVHGNHAMEYITTHPMLYKGSKNSPLENAVAYDEYKDADWYFENVEPIGRLKDAKRITIGNDVWLGRNVIIVNYSNIGNGVIAGAGTVITHDIPDYAVVVGVPARIIKYRYEKEQIEKLNSIKWWDWSDEIIRERFPDFYLPVSQFIEKYGK